VAVFVLKTNASDLPREHLSLDAGWKVHLGDDWPDAMHLENSGTGSGPAGERFADAYWRTVNLPHDWAVELPFEQTADVSHGFKALGRSFPTNSIGWYRRTFELPTGDSGKRTWLTFDGVIRSGANHRAIHAGGRRIQTDGQFRWFRAGEGSGANFVLHAAPLRAVSCQIGANEQTGFQTSPGSASEARLRASLRDGPQ
jgi:hypothetical protein